MSSGGYSSNFDAPAGNRWCFAVPGATDAILAIYEHATLANVKAACDRNRSIPHADKEALLAFRRTFHALPSDLKCTGAADVASAVRPNRRKAQPHKRSRLNDIDTDTPGETSEPLCEEQDLDRLLNGNVSGFVLGDDVKDVGETTAGDGSLDLDDLLDL